MPSWLNIYKRQKEIMYQCQHRTEEQSYCVYSARTKEQQLMHALQ